jgi:hypothetical protein
MVVLITGASHTGKTVLAQRLLERYHMPYLSMDHLKMGLIRSGRTKLTPMDSQEELTELVWPIVREMVKTAIENGQDLTVEGCYIPEDWKDGFGPSCLAQIRYVCLVMSRGYIEGHFEDIRAHANAVEHRLDDSGLSMEELIEDNGSFLRACIRNGDKYILIDDRYDIRLEDVVGRKEAF